MADKVVKISDSQVMKTYTPDPVSEVIDVAELKQLIENSQYAEDNYVAARRDERVKWQADIDLAATVGVKIDANPIDATPEPLTP